MARARGGGGGGTDPPICKQNAHRKAACPMMARHSFKGTGRMIGVLESLHEGKKCPLMARCPFEQIHMA